MFFKNCVRPQCLGGRLVYLLVSVVLCGELADAQTSADDPVVTIHEVSGKVSAPSITPVPLTLESILQLALTNNPTLASARAHVENQEGLVNQVGLYPNPTVGYVRTDPDQTGQSATQGVFLSQEFVTAGKLRLNRDIERADLQRTIWQLRGQEARIVNDVRIRYFEALGAQRTVEVTQELVQIAEEGVKLVKQLLAGKLVGEPDLLQAEIQLQSVQIALRDARYRYESAWRQLAAIVGVPYLDPRPLGATLEETIPELNWDESLKILMENSPVLKAQTSDLQGAFVAVERAKVERIPNLTVQVVAERDYAQKYSTVSTLLALPVPLFNRNQGNIKSAMAHVQESQTELRRLQLALTDQLALSFQKYSSLRNQITKLKEEILPRARKNLDYAIQGYKQRQFDFLRVLSARQILFQTQIAYIDALTEIQKTNVEIKGLQLTGGLNPTEAGTALQATQGAGASTTGVRGFLLQQLQEQQGGANRFLPGALQAR